MSSIGTSKPHPPTDIPDIIDMKQIPIDNNQSTLAIYSHAVYGYYDFHVNERRVNQWLATLRAAIQQT